MRTNSVAVSAHDITLLRFVNYRICPDAHKMPDRGSLFSAGSMIKIHNVIRILYCTISTRNVFDFPKSFARLGCFRRRIPQIVFAVLLGISLPPFSIVIDLSCHVFS